MKEKELLNKIKAELLKKGEMSVQLNTNIYVLRISAHEWHKIFKTEKTKK